MSDPCPKGRTDHEACFAPFRYCPEKGCGRPDQTVSANAAAPTSYTELAQVLERRSMLVREARRARGLSLRAAAREIGCNFSTLSRFEHGEDLVLSNAVAIVRWLDLRGFDA